MTNDSSSRGDTPGSQSKTAETPDVNSPGYRERVYEIVRRIPSGRVMNYGQLAEILGEGYTARTVGFVMHSADDTVPWQRVINAQGACSTGRVILPPDLQQRMLEAEGIIFDAKGRCDLALYRWTPEEYATDEDRGDSVQPSLFGD
ncbi:MAG: methylated-DNA-protein-cysteine methyltransferase related protein [Acidobacteriota bacterium]|jgi:methylated-DNA-protein-cysteine methyltransferase-like protein|nr:methylated-DNA-protein-cysteine methyltransferase related protein [Acidobacteriota bacterium]